VSMTTRKPRDYEVDGKHYHFVDRTYFEHQIRAGTMLEWAEFAGNLYGTPRGAVEGHLLIGTPVLLKIDLQGARQVRDAMPGALLVFLWYGGAEPAVFDVNLSFFILFMVIIGGLGSLTGSFFGAALIFIMPIVLRYLPPKLGIPVHPATVEHIQYMVIGALIILFLIAEPAGLARLWQIGKQKLRVWPFPY